MFDSIQTTKYIQKLIKVISQKQKALQLMKKEAREASTEVKRANVGRSKVDDKLSQEISYNNMEVRTLMQKMNVMEVRINELVAGLTEEINQNAFLQEQVKKIKEENKLLLLELAQIKERSQTQKLSNQNLQFTNQCLHQQNCKLQSSKQRLKDELQKMEGAIKILAHSQEEYQNFQITIGEAINSIYSSHFTNQDQEVTKATNHVKITEKTHDLEEKLDKIGSWIGQRKQTDDPQILNETIDGLSIIMKSVQEKIEGINCLTERQQEYEITKKVSTKSVDRKSDLLCKLKSSLNELKMKYNIKESPEWTNAPKSQGQYQRQ